MRHTDHRAYNTRPFILSVRNWKVPTSLIVVALSIFGYLMISQPSNSEAKVEALAPPLESFNVGLGRRSFVAQMGRDTKSAYLGTKKLQQVILSGQAQPLTMVADDFNGDGMSDLIIGYADQGRGVLSLRAGNLESIAPKEETLKGISEGRYPAPFLTQATLYGLPEAPSFLEVGDFNADGYSDVLAATRGGNQLYLAHGNGRGELKPVETITLDGNLTAMKAGVEQLGRHTEVALGLMTADGAKLAHFSAANGGVAGTSDLYVLPTEISSLAFADLNQDDASDVAAAVSNDVYIFHGRSADQSVKDAAQIERVSFPGMIKGLATGDFIFDRGHQTELAVLAPDGTAYISGRGQLDTRAYSAKEKEAVRKMRIAIKKGEQDPQSLTTLLQSMARRSNENSNWSVADSIATGVTPVFDGAAPPVFKSGRTVGMPTDDLIIGDSLNGGVKTIRNMADARKLKTKDIDAIAATSELKTEGGTLAVLSLRTSIGVEPGSVVLQKGKIEPLVVILVAQTYTVDTTIDSAAVAQQGCVLATPNDCSLRGAIIKSNGNVGADTIVLAAATTYTLTLGPYDDEFNFGGDAAQSGDLDIFDSVSISGGNRDTTIIQMGILAPAPGGINKDRVLETNNFIALQHAYNVTLSNLTIQNGGAPRTPAPDNYNTAGGGIMYDGFETNTNTPSGILTLTNTKVSANTAAGQGGGITTVDATLILQTTSIVRANTSTFAAGGGISYNGGNTVQGQTLQINGSTIGGALLADGNIANDTTFGIGAGVDSVGGAGCTISNGAVLQNNQGGITTGLNGGGGIHFGNTPAIAISNTTISNNLSKNHGGGLWSSARNAVTNAASTISLTTVTIQNNQADSDNLSNGDGGGIYNFFGAMTINNTGGGSITGNTAFNGGGIASTWTGNTIDSTAPLTLTTGTNVSSNSARNNGGGIHIDETAAATPTIFGAVSLTSLTLNANTANSDSAGGGDGGGLYIGTVPVGWVTTLNTVTIDSNVANGGAGDGIRQAGGAISASNTINVNGADSLYLSGGTFTSTSGTLNLSGNLTRDAANTFNHNNGTVNFNGSGAQLLNGTATSITFSTFIVNKSGGTLSTAGSLATLTTTTYTNTAGGFTAPATMDINGNVTLTAGTFTAGANIFAALNWTNNGATFAPGTGTVTFDGAVAQAINGTAGSQTFNNVIINKGAGSTLSTGVSTTSLTVNNLTQTLGNFIAPAVLDINASMTLTAGIFTAGASITVGGSWTQTAGSTFTPGSGTVTFDNNTAATLGGSQTTQTFNNFVVNKPGATLNGGASLTTLTLTGSMTITAGTFNAGTITTINVPGDWSNTGTFTPAGSTVILNGVGNTQTLSGTTTFNNLTSNHTGGGSVTSAGSTLNVNGLLRIQAGTFTIGNASLANLQIDNTTSLVGTNATTINVIGNWTNNSNPGFTPNGNTVNFNGNGIQSLGGTAVTQTFNNFIVNKGAGSTLSVVANTSILDINGNVTLTIGGFAAGTATTITVAGNWTNNGGTFTPGSGTVTFDGGAGQTIGGTNATTFNHLTNGNASGLAMSNNNNVNGILALMSSDITVAAGMTLTQASTIPSTGLVFDVIGNVKRTNTPSQLASGVALTFGNPNNQINFTAAGTRPTEVTVNLVKAAPIDFPTAVQRTYTITPTGGAGYSATLRLRYLETELNGNTEAGLGLWRFGTVWARQGSTASDAANNWVELSGVTQFSPWTLSSAKNNSTTLITADTPDPSGINQAVPINWSVTSDVAGAPALTGNVTITVNDASGDTCTAAVGAGTCNLTLTTAGSKTLTATYVGDANFNGGSDTEPHGVVEANVSVRDARAAEPASGTSNMLFTVTLSAPATGASSVNYATANDTLGSNPATGGTCAGGADYATTSGTVNFTAGQQVQTVSVVICSDATSEPDETLLLNLSVPVNLNISDGQATGTITPNTPGEALISEIRTSGPGGADDDYVEIYNNSDSPVIVQAEDGSLGVGLFKMGADCNATPVLLGFIPNDTVIPARGHYLFVGASYSLDAYATPDFFVFSDIENDRNVAFFSTMDVTNLSSVTLLDAVGFGANTGGGICDLLREGTNLQPAGGSTAQYTFARKLNTGLPQDTNDNAADFLLVATDPTVAVGSNPLPILGAPGPENLASPLQRNATIKPSLVDPLVASTVAPNRVRDTNSYTDTLTPSAPNGGLPASNPYTLGTLTFRRKFTNNTGAPVTRLRFRIIDITTTNTPGGPLADLRTLTSPTVVVTVTGGGTPTVQGLTLEQTTPQARGGGANTSVAAGIITMAMPLADGASINVNLVTGVVAGGSFRFFINVEALP